MKEILSNSMHPEIRDLLTYATSKENIEKAYETYISQENQKLYGYEYEGEFVGCIGIELNSSNSCEIKHIAVSKNQRGRRIGSKMIHFIRDAYNLELITAETDRDAVNFYRNYGFEISSLGEKYPGVERFWCELRDD